MTVLNPQISLISASIKCHIAFVPQKFSYVLLSMTGKEHTFICLLIFYYNNCGLDMLRQYNMNDICFLKHSKIEK